MKSSWLVTIAVTVAIGGGLWWYQRQRFGGAPASETERLCAADFPGLPAELVRKRCTCVIESLEGSDEGRAVLKTILEHKQFLRTIESAASHASVLDAMNVCGQ